MGTDSTGFTLDKSSGQILLAGTLDRETNPSYSLLVKATDSANTVTATVALTVTDENDNAPVFNPNSYRLIIISAEHLKRILAKA